jgi:endo-1,4-beta-mannosidase
MDSDYHMTYDIILGQGDGDNVPIQIKCGGLAKNLEEASVILAMENDLKTIHHEITCLAGASILITPDNYVLLEQTADKIGNVVEFSVDDNWFTIPFTSTHTATAGRFFGNFPFTLSGDQHTAPSDEDDITILIKKKRYVDRT